MLIYYKNLKLTKNMLHIIYNIITKQNFINFVKVRFTLLIGFVEIHYISVLYYALGDNKSLSIVY